MYVRHQFSHGALSITLYETPFCLKAEYTNTDGYVWSSEKYTIVSLNGWKLSNMSIKMNTLAEKISLIWVSVLQKPLIGLKRNDMVVNFGSGVVIMLKRKNTKIKLAPIMEAEERENQCECEVESYTLSKCPQDSHIRCSRDIDEIEALRNENVRLREEIVALHLFGLREGH